MGFLGLAHHFLPDLRASNLMPHDMRVCWSHCVITLINLHFGLNCNSRSSSMLSVLTLMGKLHLSWKLVPCYLESCSISIGTMFHISWNNVPNQLERNERLINTWILHWWCVMISLKLFRNMSILCGSWMSVCGRLACCLRCDNFECACASLRNKSQIACTFALAPLRERCNT